MVRSLCVVILTCDAYFFVFFYQAEDGIRDLVRSRGLGDVYKRQVADRPVRDVASHLTHEATDGAGNRTVFNGRMRDTCLLYTSDAADERSSVDLGGRRIIKKKTNRTKSSRELINDNDNEIVMSIILNDND